MRIMIIFFYRSVANNQHRKSLPNIHAANFNFMDPTKTGGSTTVQMRIRKSIRINDNKLIKVVIILLKMIIKIF